MIPPVNRNLTWNVLESRYISREPWHTVREEKVQLPNGNIIPNYYVLEYPDWVSVIALTKEKKMVLIQQYRHARGGVFYEIPAGTSESGDASMLHAAKRELMEETGYGGGVWREYMVISANP